MLPPHRISRISWPKVCYEALLRVSGGIVSFSSSTSYLVLNYLSSIEVVGPLSQNMQRHFVLSLSMSVVYLVSVDERAKLARRKLAVVNTTSAVQSVEVRSSPFYPRRSEICRSIAVRELVHHAVQTLEMRHSRVRWMFATETSRHTFARQLPRASDRVVNINSVGLYRVSSTVDSPFESVSFVQKFEKFSIERSLGKACSF